MPAPGGVDELNSQLEELDTEQLGVDWPPGMTCLLLEEPVLEFALTRDRLRRPRSWAIAKKVPTWLLD